MRALLGFAMSAAALAASASSQAQKPTLAELAAGTYRGDVISDARGSSQSDVTVTVTVTGKNEIAVTTDYERIPDRTFKLARAMDTIQNVGGTEVFLLDLSRDPQKLDLTIDDASWSGEREALTPAAPADDS
jgi:hypothetical protein